MFDWRSALRRSRIRSGALAALVAVTITADAASPAYKQLQLDCDGLPQLAIGSMDGSCLGLLAEHSEQLPWRMPRKVVELPESRQLLVTDMGGWSGKKGVVWLLQLQAPQGYGGGYTASQLLSGLLLPHDIKLGPGGYVYVGEADRIIRFRIKNRQPVDQSVVIESLPYAGKKYLHPLTNFVFLGNNDLLVNVGSRTDACKGYRPIESCPDIGKAGLLRFPYLAHEDRWQQTPEQYATGLRNSMALVVHSSGTVLQGENSSDIKDAAEPYEELNQIHQGGFYGWPYCLDRQLDTGLLAQGCAQPNYQPPYSLMPPHVAPLDMLYYRSDRLPALTGKLLLSWHGYRVVGHRIVAYSVDEQGLPLLGDQARFRRDPIPPATEFTQHVFAASGGTGRVAQHQEVVSEWNRVGGQRVKGAPVGLFELADGSLLIVDDRNKALLRLSTGQPYPMAQGQAGLTPVGPAAVTDYAYSGRPQQLLLERCSACHGELASNPAELLNAEHGWLRQENGSTVLQQRLQSESRFMPPTGPLSADEQAAILKAVR